MYGGNSFTKIRKLPNNGHFVRLLETQEGTAIKQYPHSKDGVELFNSTLLQLT
jgi:hypothetical protein